MGRKPRVIFFEDDQDVREMVELLLKTNGCEVFTYADPSQSLLQKKHDCHCGEDEVCADIVITDIDMPVVSGLDFIEEQVQKGCKVKKLAILSGVWTDQDVQRAKKLGCTVFSKPSFFSDISDWIEQCLAERDTRVALSDWFLEE